MKKLVLVLLVGCSMTFLGGIVAIVFLYLPTIKEQMWFDSLVFTSILENRYGERASELTKSYVDEGNSINYIKHYYIPHYYLLINKESPANRLLQIASNVEIVDEGFAKKYDEYGVDGYNIRVLNYALGNLIKIANKYIDTSFLGRYDYDAVVIDKERVPLLVYFFSGAVAGDQGELQVLREGYDELSVEWQVVVGQVLARSTDGVVPSVAEPGGIDRLWLSYQLTGDEDYVRAVVDSIYDDAVFYDEAMRDKVFESLATYGLLNKQSYDLFKGLCEAATGEESRYEEFMYSIGQRMQYAWNVNTVAYNLRKQGDWERVKGAVEHGVAVSGGLWSWHVSELQYYYVDMHDKKNEYFATVKSYELDRNDVRNIYSLANMYYYQNKFQQSIDLFEEVLTLNPEYHAAIHALGCVYEEMGDVDNAVKHYTAYLAKKPLGYGHEEAKRYLEKVGKPYVAEGNTLLELLVAKEYDALENAHKEKQRIADDSPMGYEELRDYFYKLCPADTVASSLSEWIPVYDAWVKARPDSAFARTCAANVYIDYAWEARGNGLGYTITETGGKLFRQRLEIAKNYLEESVEIDEGNYLAYSGLLVAGKGLGLDDQVMEAYFKKGIAIKPNYHPLYTCRLDSLKPKWGGTVNEMFAFAKRYAASAPRPSKIPVIVLNAHEDRAYTTKDAKMYYREPMVWKSVEPVLARFSQDFSDDGYWINKCAHLYYLSGKYELARPLFDKIGNAPDQSVWGGDSALFERAKAAVYQGDDAAGVVTG